MAEENDLPVVKKIRRGATPYPKNYVSITKTRQLMLNRIDAKWLERLGDYVRIHYAPGGSVLVLKATGMDDVNGFKIGRTKKDTIRIQLPDHLRAIPQGLHPATWDRKRGGLKVEFG